MKKFSILIMLIISMLMISMLMPSTVFAAGAFQVELASDKAEAKEGETVLISISLANLNVTTGEQGIGAYLAKIEYDTEIFEKAIFSGNENWEGSMEGGNITGVTADGKVATQAETIATLSLTVKENAKVGNTTITISNFVGSDAVNDISANSNSIDITVIKENNNQNQEDSNKNETNTESNITDNNSTNSSVNNNTNSNSNANNNTNSNVSGDASSNNETNNSTNSNVSDDESSNNEANNDSTNSNVSDDTSSDNEANNDSTNSNVSDATNSNNDTNNSNTDPTDDTLSNEQTPPAGNKTRLYVVITVISFVLLALIVAIYICYRKQKQRMKRRESL